MIWYGMVNVNLYSAIYIVQFWQLYE